LASPELSWKPAIWFPLSRDTRAGIIDGVDGLPNQTRQRHDCLGCGAEGAVRLWCILRTNGPTFRCAYAPYHFIGQRSDPKPLFLSIQVDKDSPFALRKVEDAINGIVVVATECV
jgi:hypothetical protein